MSGSQPPALTAELAAQLALGGALLAAAAAECTAAEGLALRASGGGAVSGVRLLQV